MTPQAADSDWDHPEIFAESRDLLGQIEHHTALLTRFAAWELDQDLKAAAGKTKNETRACGVLIFCRDCRKILECKRTSIDCPSTGSLLSRVIGN